MGKSTWSGPIQAGNKDGGALGQVVLVQSFDFTEADLAAPFATDIVLPAGARILDIFVDTPVIFDGADTLELGDGTDADAIADIAALNGAARITAARDVPQTLFGNDLAAETTITVTASGSTSTTGEGVLTVKYQQVQNAVPAN